MGFKAGSVHCGSSAAGSSSLASSCPGNGFGQRREPVPTQRAGAAASIGNALLHLCVGILLLVEMRRQIAADNPAAGRGHGGGAATPGARSAPPPPAPTSSAFKVAFQLPRAGLRRCRSPSCWPTPREAPCQASCPSQVLIPSECPGLPSPREEKKGMLSPAGLLSVWLRRRDFFQSKHSCNVTADINRQRRRREKHSPSGETGYIRKHASRGEYQTEIKPLFS